MLSSTSGGSGEFVHVAVFGVRDGALANLGTAPVGDRTRLQSLWLERGKILMDVIEVGPDDAACCPTQVARKTYGWRAASSSSCRARCAACSRSACWPPTSGQLVEIDGQPLPAGVDPPLIHFEATQVRGFAGCNRFNAPVKEPSRARSTSARPAGTKMACPPAKMELEQRFLAQLDAVNRYSVPRRATCAQLAGRRTASGSAAVPEVARRRPSLASVAVRVRDRSV